jgi:hypothetical protein
MGYAEIGKPGYENEPPVEHTNDNPPPDPCDGCDGKTMDCLTCRCMDCEDMAGNPCDGCESRKQEGN